MNMNMVFIDDLFGQHPYLEDVCCLLELPEVVISDVTTKSYEYVP